MNNNNASSTTLLNRSKLNITGETEDSLYLSVTNHSVYRDPLFTTTEGSIINNSSNTMNSIKAIVQYYNENNSLITADSDTIDLVILNAGQSSTFNVDTQLGDIEIARYKVIPGGDIGS